MKIFDISQKVFGCCVYPGDPTPQLNRISSTENGDPCNLSEFFMCAHNGTHIDAPFHFFPLGDRVEQIPLWKTVGFARVVSHKGELSEEDAESIIRSAKSSDPVASKKLLIKGDAVITDGAASVFAREKLELLGTESQTVGDPSAPMAAHLELLGAKTVLLEGIRLDGVSDGVYLLCAAPLNLNGADGAPCRAVLIEL